MKKIPFKLMVVDRGDWVILPAGKNARDEFRAYHRRGASRAAKLFAVPVSYRISEDGLTYRKAKKETWEPVLIGRV